MSVAHAVVQLRCHRRPYELVMDDGSVFFARTIVIATGACYNKPDVADRGRFEGRGNHYGATYIEAQLCEREDVIVVGGGDSDGQAAVFLLQTARKVYMLVRSAGLAETMSRYLIQSIASNPSIELLCGTEIVGLRGEEQLGEVSWVDRKRRRTTTVSLRRQIRYGSEDALRLTIGASFLLDAICQVRSPWTEASMAARTRSPVARK